VRQQFTLKERDVETGLDYFLGRYYSPIQGRFTSPDEFRGGPVELYYFVSDAAANPTFYADLRNPQSLNKYQYSYNNPLRYVDPDGHAPDQKCNCPTDQEIIEALQSGVNKVADATGITSTAVKIRLVGAFALSEALSLIEKYGDRIAPCNDCVYNYQNSSSQRANLKELLSMVPSIPKLPQTLPMHRRQEDPAN
jgi:RHS repeat-associated protein